MREALQEQLAAASDAQLARVVALLDALPVRGLADRLLDGLRPRLVALGLRRPLNFGRLLFTPLDPLIRDAQDPPLHWVPRQALPLLIQAVQQRLGQPGLAIAAACEPLVTANFRAVAELGARLWPAAAQALPAAPPPGWTDAGLPLSAYAGIAATCRSLWRHALPVRAALAPQAMGEPVPIRRALQDPAREGERYFTPVVSALVAGAGRPGVVLRVAHSLEPKDCRHSLALLDRFLERGFAVLPVPDSGLAQRAEAAVALVHDLRAATLVLRPGGDARMRRVAEEVAGRCGAEFRRYCADALLRPLAEARDLAALEPLVAALQPHAAAIRRAADALAGLGHAGGEEYGRVAGLVAQLQDRWAPPPLVVVPPRPPAPPALARAWS